MIGHGAWRLEDRDSVRQNRMVLRFPIGREYMAVRFTKLASEHKNRKDLRRRS